MATNIVNISVLLLQVGLEETEARIFNRFLTKHVKKNSDEALFVAVSIIYTVRFCLRYLITTTGTVSERVSVLMRTL